MLSEQLTLLATTLFYIPILNKDLAKPLSVLPTVLARTDGYNIVYSLDARYDNIKLIAVNKL